MLQLNYVPLTSRHATPAGAQETALEALSAVRARQDGDTLAAARPHLPQLEEWRGKPSTEVEKKKLKNSRNQQNS